MGQIRGAESRSWIPNYDSKYTRRIREEGGFEFSISLLYWIYSKFDAFQDWVCSWESEKERTLGIVQRTHSLTKSASPSHGDSQNRCYESSCRLYVASSYGDESPSLSPMNENRITSIEIFLVINHLVVGIVLDRSHCSLVLEWHTDSILTVRKRTAGENFRVYKIRRYSVNGAHPPNAISCTGLTWCILLLWAQWT